MDEGEVSELTVVHRYEGSLIGVALSQLSEEALTQLEADFLASRVVGGAIIDAIEPDCNIVLSDPTVPSQPVPSRRLAPAPHVSDGEPVDSWGLTASPP